MPLFVCAMASPLYAPLAELSPRCTSVEGGGGGRVGFHPRIFPSSVAKMKIAGAELTPSETRNPGPPLNTRPVGALGTLTVSGTFAPVLPL